MTVNYPYEDEIDLRKWIQVILRAKWLILATMVILGVLGFFLASLLPQTYEATAIAAVTQVRNNLRFDPRIETVINPTINYQSYATLATSDGVVETLFEALDELPSGVSTANELRKKLLSTEVHTDLILLKVQHTDRSQAENIANRWVDIFVKRANEVYSSQAVQQIAFYEGQMVGAREALAKADQALIEFQSRSRENILRGEIVAQQAALNSYLNDQQSGEVLLRDIDSLISQLNILSTDQQVSAAIQLSAVLLQSRNFSDDRDVINPQQIQVNVATTTPITAGEQILELEGLKSAVQNQLADLDELIAEQEPKITAAQQQLQTAITERERLENERSVAEETLTTISRKVEETRIGSDDSAGQARLASKAIASDEPVTTSRLIIAGIAAVAGFLIAVSVALFAAWWRDTSKMEKAAI